MKKFHKNTMPFRRGKRVTFNDWRYDSDGELGKPDFNKVRDAIKECVRFTREWMKEEANKLGERVHADEVNYVMRDIYWKPLKAAENNWDASKSSYYYEYFKPAK